MVALAGVGRFFHLAQQGVHFRNGQATSCAHGAMAGHGGANLVQLFGKRESLAQMHDLVRQIAHEADDVRLSEERGHLAHQNGGGTEALDHKAKGLKIGGPGLDGVSGDLIQLYDLRQQQHLALDAALGQCRFHALINEALVSGVLIDDDHAAVVGLGNHLGVVDLCAGSAKREASEVFARILLGGGMRRGA